jgi:hypothetical protein
MTTILALDDKARLTIPEGWVRFVRHGITYTRGLEGWIIATDADGLHWAIAPVPVTPDEARPSF